jgi:hypothetical protein
MTGDDDDPQGDRRRPAASDDRGDQGGPSGGKRSHSGRQAVDRTGRPSLARPIPATTALRFADQRHPYGMEMTPEDLLEAAAASRRALASFIAADWSVQAGDLNWDVRATVAHVCDALGWYAAHLAMQSSRRLQFDFCPHAVASNDQLLDVMTAAAATLAAVVRAGPPGVRAYHNHGMADASGFLAMACDETLIHGWDAVRGLGEEFSPPAELAERVLCRLFPWTPINESPWPTLLWANGRTELPDKERLGPDWAWHCAPLVEWDGTVPRDDANPPNRYEWDNDARRWIPSW